MVVTDMAMATARKASALATLVMMTSVSAHAQTDNGSPASGGDAVGIAQGLASQSPGRFTSGVRTQITVSDNIDLVDDGESSGATLEIGPYFNYAIDKPTFRTNFSYGLRYFNTTGDLGSEGVRHDVRGRLKSALWRDVFWVDSIASVTESVRDLVNSGTVDPARQEGSQKRNTAQRYAIAPYISDYLGDRNTSYVLGYGASFAKNTGRDDAQITQRLIGSVSRDPNRRGLGWSLESEQSNNAFESSDETYNTSRVTIEALVRPNGKLRIGAGAQYDRVSVLRDESGDNSGWAPTVSTLWTPNQRTNFNARYSKPYFGSTAAAGLTYQPGRWSVGIQYRYGLTDRFSGPLAGAGVRSTLASGGRPSNESSVVNQLLAGGTLPTTGETITDGFVSGAISRTRRLSVNAGWAGQRTSFSVGASRRRSESQLSSVDLPTTDGAPNALEQTTLTVGATRRIDPRTSGTVKISTSTSTAVDDSAKSRLNVFSLSWNRQLNRNTTILVSYRLAHQRASVDRAETYREQAIVMGANYRF